MQQLSVFQNECLSVSNMKTKRVSRRVKTAPIPDDNLTCRRDRLVKRNMALVARYYYWCELRRRRYDDVLKILEDKEFFVEYQTLNNALAEYNEYYSSLVTNKVSATQLKKDYPSFDWSISQ